MLDKFSRELLQTVRDTILDIYYAKEGAEIEQKGKKLPDFIKSGKSIILQVDTGLERLVTQSPLDVEISYVDETYVGFKWKGIDYKYGEMTFEAGLPICQFGDYWTAYEVV